MKAFAKQFTRGATVVTAMMVLSSCSPPQFAPVSFSNEEASTTPNPQSPTPAKLSDLLLQTEMNSPIEFTPHISIPAGKGFLERTIAVDAKGGVSALTPNGRLEVLDQAHMRLRYTPNTNFRGEDFGFIFLIEDEGRYLSSAIVRIQVDSALVSLKPALAVRGTGCIMCHATISSNVITDFGYGDSYFFGGPTLAPVDHTSIYSDESTDPAWKYAKRLGAEVIVPQASTAHLSKVGAPSLAAYLQGALASATSANVKSTRITEVDSVYIGAPSASRILSAARFTPGLEAVKYIPDFNQPAFTPALIHKAEVAGQNHYTNDPSQNFICSGDLIVDGVVFLNNLVVESDTGCRIYATGSVFVRGPVSYVNGNAARRNLQIVSARSINLGLGRNTCAAPQIGTDSLLNRLQTEDRRKFFATRGEPEKTTQQKLDDIVADYQKIGGGLLDAACDTTGRSVGFERLILNAPIIFSRYTGGFKGSMISEIALMSLDQFVFEFDPIFSKETVLPLLSPNDYLVVK